MREHRATSTLLKILRCITIQYHTMYSETKTNVSQDWVKEIHWYTVQTLFATSLWTDPSCWGGRVFQTLQLNHTFWHRIADGEMKLAKPHGTDQSNYFLLGTRFRKKTHTHMLVGNEPTGNVGVANISRSRSCCTVWRNLLLWLLDDDSTMIPFRVKLHPWLGYGAWHIGSLGPLYFIRCGCLQVCTYGVRCFALRSARHNSHNHTVPSHCRLLGSCRWSKRFWQVNGFAWGYFQPQRIALYREKGIAENCSMW